MKVLIFSDSHRHNGNMEAVIARLQDINHVLHLGDNSEDAEKMERAFPGRRFEWVSGNCDFSAGPADKLLSLGGKKILITHGHTYGVKYGYQRITYTALEKEVDACFFGHTHLPAVFYENGVLFLNPGSISLPRDGQFPTYGVADISENGIGGSIVTLRR